MSSAYKAASESSGMTSGRSFMNKTNSIGPRILPCGTPDVTEHQLDTAPSITTLCVLPVK